MCLEIITYRRKPYSKQLCQPPKIPSDWLRRRFPRLFSSYDRVPDEPYPASVADTYQPSAKVEAAHFNAHDITKAQNRTGDMAGTVDPGGKGNASM